MNTQAIRDQTKVIDDLRAKLNKNIDARNKVLAVRCGQECAAISIAGASFQITTHNRAYMPELIKGMERIQLECASILQSEIDNINSRILGAENALRKLIKFTESNQ